MLLLREKNENEGIIFWVNKHDNRKNKEKELTSDLKKKQRLWNLSPPPPPPQFGKTIIKRIRQFLMFNKGRYNLIESQVGCHSYLFCECLILGW